MHKSKLAICISMALVGRAAVAAIRQGPVSPYKSESNRAWYYRQFGQVITARSMGKTQVMKELAWPFHYQG